MVIRELGECVRSLYGGLETKDLLSAVEDGVITVEEKDELAALVREENYRKLLAGCAERCRLYAVAMMNKRFEDRKAALAERVQPGMVLRGKTWMAI